MEPMNKSELLRTVMSPGFIGPNFASDFRRYDTRFFGLQTWFVHGNIWHQKNMGDVEDICTLDTLVAYCVF